MYVSLDLETTGFDSEKDRIIEFGAVKFDKTGKEIARLSFLANPGILLPEIIIHITKIKDSDLEGVEPFESHLQEVKDFVGDFPIIGHNIEFDTGFLKANNIPLTNAEYDTHILARMFLPNAPSYSLEILSEIFDLQHKEKHRALDDAIAAMELFIKLQEKVKELDFEILKKIKELNEKASWPFKDFFSDISFNKGVKKEKDLSPKVLDLKLSSFASDIVKSSNSSLFETIPPYSDLVKELIVNEDKDTYISVPHNLFREIYKELPDNIAKLDLDKNYISLKRLQELENQDSFEDHEISALIKYLIWMQRTNSGLLSEAPLFMKEKKTISLVSADPNFVNSEDEFFIKKAKEADKNNAAICSHEYVIENEIESKKLIIIDFDEFTQKIHNTKSTFINFDSITYPLSDLLSLYPENELLNKLLTKCGVLFETIGLIFQNTNDKNAYYPKTELNLGILNSKEWEELLGLFSSLIELSKGLLDISNEKTFGYLQNWKYSLIKLSAILRSSDINKNIVLIEKDRNGKPFMKKTPFSIKENLKNIFEKNPNYQLVGECFDLLDQGKFIQTLYGIDPELSVKKELISSPNLQILLSNEESNSDTLLELSRGLKGNTAIIFNSKKLLQEQTLFLSSNLSDTKIVSQLTGSLGKVSAQYSQDPQNSILALTPHYWNYFQHHDLVKNLIIFKIPFDAPSNPFILSSSKNFADPFNQLQIPRALMSMLKIINRIVKNSDDKKVIILDPRIKQKQYGQVIKSNLEVLAKTEFYSVASLVEKCQAK